MAFAEPVIPMANRLRHCVITTVFFRRYSRRHRLAGVRRHPLAGNFAVAPGRLSPTAIQIYFSSGSRVLVKSGIKA